MKPYKLNETWIDLDHVLQVTYERSWSRSDFIIHVKYMFSSEALINFDHPDKYADPRPSEEEKLSWFLSEHYEPFLEVWKNKDKSL